MDAPLSGGSTRAAEGDLTILCAGLPPPQAAGPSLAVLRALSGSKGNASNLVLVPGGPGAGAAMKALNQHLAGTHIVLVAEYLALACALGLPLRLTRELWLEGPAASFILFHRGQNMLDGLLRPPTARMDIWTKDLAIVLAEARRRGCGVQLAAAAYQVLLLGNGCGWGADDDSRCVPWVVIREEARWSLTDPVWSVFGDSAVST